MIKIQKTENESGLYNKSRVNTYSNDNGLHNTQSKN